MNTTFEKLSNQLFSERIDKKQMAKTMGGKAEGSCGKSPTYVTINTDMYSFTDDENGKITFSIVQDLAIPSSFA